jgi:DNA-binding MarR family transcriptional regulator
MDNANREDICENLLDVFHLIHHKILKSGPRLTLGRLSRQQYTLMSNLDRHTGLSISNLSRKIMMTKPRMTVMLGRLSDMGMIERMTDIHDRRITHIALTASGRADLNEHRLSLRQDIKSNLAALTPEEMYELSRAVQIIKNIGNKLD